MGSRGLNAQRRPTLKDVAAVAKVDPSLVSRVVNSDPGLSIPDETRRRVLEAIEQVGYRPNVAARGLALARTLTLGLVIPNLNNPVYAPIAIGAQRRAETRGYAIVLGNESEELAPTARSLTSLLTEERVDGLLVASGAIDDHVRAASARRSLPIVTVNRRVSGIPASVVVDDEAGAALATQHLVELGHTNIGHIAGPGGIDTSLRRAKGYQHVMRDAGLRRKRGWTVSAEAWDATAGARAAHQLLTREPEVTALFVATVTMAIGVLRAAHDLNFPVPTRLSVVALHDFDLAEFLIPSLTTVAMPLERLGAVAVDLALDMLDGKQARSVVVEEAPHLCVRESATAPVR